MGTIFVTMGYASTIISRHRSYAPRWWSGDSDGDAGAQSAKE